MIGFIKQKYQNYQRSKSIKSIRLTMAMFGHDMSELSGEEVEDRVENMERVMAAAFSKSGVTCAQAANSLRKARHYITPPIDQETSRHC